MIRSRPSQTLLHGWVAQSLMGDLYTQGREMAVFRADDGA